jgi:hypothetical protein
MGKKFGTRLRDAGKIRIFEFYSTKSKPLGRSKWVTEDELSKIYHGILPDPFA